MEDAFFTGMSGVMTLFFATSIIMLAILGLVLLIAHVIDEAGLFWNFKILKRGRTPNNPTNLRFVRTPFFRVKEIEPNRMVAKINGVYLCLGFRDCQNCVYAQFPLGIIENLIPGRIYDRHNLKEM